MANFPILRTERTPSGRGANIPTPTSMVDTSGMYWVEHSCVLEELPLTKL